MILRRFMKHVTDQNWFAVGLDVLVVIFGVYIGIFLGNIQTERQIALDTEKVLFLLRDELRSDLDRLDEVVAFQRNKNEKTREAIELLATKGASRSVIHKNIDIATGDNTTFYPSKSAYETLKTSGFLAAHPNADLRQQISLVFERTYDRQDMNAVLYDNMIYDVIHTTIIPNWDLVEGRLYENSSDGASKIRSGLLGMVRQGEYYQEFLANAVRSRMEQTIEMIETSERRERKP